MITDSMIKGIGMTSQRTRERLIRRLQEEGIRNKEVLGAIMDTPRHLFMDEALASRAYEDTALPIGHGQTISQPYIVARMTELLTEGKTTRLDKVLEVGTGCGYQTAVLSSFANKVYTVERIDALLQQARKRFRLLKLKNIRCEHSDGSWGWDRYAPYDGILVTCAPPELPPALLAQLAPGARMVIPVGGGGIQELSVITRTADGYEQVMHEQVSFVPLLGGQV
jgi:protein-L-isoaspartate(D-aspartate) O-methyltransferase